MFAIIPVTNTALGTLPPERVKNASGLFNLMRNLGGAIGLAAIKPGSTTAWTCISPACTRRSIPPASPRSRRCRISHHASRAPTRSRRRCKMFNMVRLQAAVMSYADVFLMMTVLFLALAAFGLLMRRPQAVAVAEH